MYVSIDYIPVDTRPRWVRTLEADELRFARKSHWCGGVSRRPNVLGSFDHLQLDFRTIGEIMDSASDGSRNTNKLD